MMLHPTAGLILAEQRQQERLAEAARWRLVRMAEATCLSIAAGVSPMWGQRSAIWSVSRSAGSSGAPAEPGLCPPPVNSRCGRR